MNKKVLLLIDGNSLMFRAYYATAYSGNLMKTTDGVYTNALFGFCNMLHKRLSEETEYVFIAFDAGSKTFRHQSFEEYKATRKPLPEELKVQIPIIKEYLDIMQVTRAESDLYEADDLLASVANKFYKDFDQIRVITGDRDLLQLVNSKVTVCLTKRGIGELEEYNHENFYSLTGLHPNQITDYKGMAGDASDNLPGIKGVGEKTALKLLNQYQSLENIINNIEHLPGRTKDLFSINKAMGLRCKELATLKGDIELDYNINDLEVKEYNHEELASFFQQYEFYSFLKRMDKEFIFNEAIIPTIITDVSANLKDILNKDSYICIEMLTDNYFAGTFLGLGMAIDNKYLFFTKEVVKKNVHLKQYLENQLYAKETYDWKMLYSVLKRIGINVENVSFDLLLAAYLINPSFASNDFKKTIDNFHNNDLPYYENVYGANTKIRIPEIKLYSTYSVNKCEVIKRISNELKKQINDFDLTELLNIEMNLSKVLADVEINGLLIDVNHLDSMGYDLILKTEDISKKIYAIAGEKFNINSPKQLGEILFEKLHLPHKKRTKTGFSTNVEVLEKLSNDYPIARYILEYRAYNKLITTYINGLKEVVDNENYVHPIYKQALTATGRLSSVEPNIQNIPTRTEEGQMIREAFISRFPNGYIMSADYSQIELRVLAHLSEDENMITAFNKSVDFHALTASQIFEINISEVNEEMRRTAKAINFGIIYGMSSWGLSEAINISPLEANIYINKYFYTYQKIKKYLDSIIDEVKENGYSKTILNRRRYIPEVLSSNANLRAAGERTAMNAPIQGSAADIIKVAMVNIDNKMKELGLKSLMIAQVHDELIFDCLPVELEKLQELIINEMTNAVKLHVKLVADIKNGKNWAETK